jgi:hypothetical protein
MTKKLFTNMVGISFTACMILANSSLVLAVDSTPTASPSTLKIMRQEIQTDRKENRETVRTNVAHRHASRLERRFGFYVTRLTKIADRIQSRIDKEKTEGKDVSSAQTNLDSARTKLTQAQVDGTKAVAAFNAITPEDWDQQKADVQAAKDLAKNARQEFVDARKLMVDAVQALTTN